MAEKRGRPSPYNPDEYPAAARLLASEGKTHTDMAKFFGVERHCIATWRERHAEFDAAIRLGLEDASDSVERSLWQRATGYSWKSEKIVVVPQGKGVPSIAQRVPIVEHAPPDVNAIRFWLTNRRSDRWKEKPDDKPPQEPAAVLVIEPAPKPPGAPLPPETPGPAVDPPAPA